MKLHELLRILDQAAPLRYAESWDNVGLITGEMQQEISHALLTIDCTQEVLEEARDGQLVIAYHPPMFEAVKRIAADSIVYRAIRRGIALYSPHTAFDVAEGGTNDVLAQVLGMTDPRPLKPLLPSPWHFKLVTYVPAAHLDTLAEALFAAGAGWIGNYSHCSFRSEGTGTFLGQEGTHPAVGQPGRLERTSETRIETIVPASKVTAVIEALKANHPYEEPAFDLLQLATAPEGKGMGKLGPVESLSRRALIERIRTGLGVEHLLVAGPTEGEVRRAACCAGACGSLINEALAQKVDLLLTGEVRHHDALKAAAAGMTLVCALHSNSERLALPSLAARLSQEAPTVQFQVSTRDRDPFTII